MKTLTLADLNPRAHEMLHALATRYATRHATITSDTPIPKHDIGRVASNIYTAALVAIDNGQYQMEELSPFAGIIARGSGMPTSLAQKLSGEPSPLVESLRIIANTEGYYLRRSGWRDYGYEETERSHERIDSPAFDGTGLYSRTPSPAAMVAAIDAANETGSIWATTTKPATLTRRSRIRCNRGHRTPPRQTYRELVSDGPIYSNGQHIATRLRIDRVYRYQLRRDQTHTGWRKVTTRVWADTISNRNLPKVRIGVPVITDETRDRILFGKPHWHQIGSRGFAQWLATVAPLPASTGHDPFVRYQFTPRPTPRPLPRTENETTPTNSPTRWNQTHTRPERSLMGPAELAAYVAAHGELPSRN